MEKILKNPTTANVLLVETTPEMLREIANRMEMASRAAMPQEYTMVPFTTSITFCYKPEVSRMNFIKISEKDETFKEILERKESEISLSTLEKSCF